MTQVPHCNAPSTSSSLSQVYSSKSAFHIPCSLNLNIEYLSLLERLPKELLWIIIGFAHESIFDLRLSSWLIQSSVDEFALTSTRLVESLTFFEYRSIIRMEIHVPLNVSSIFELRFKLLQLQLRLEKRNPGRNDSFNLNVYKLDINPNEMVDEQIFEDLEKCIGRRIGKVVIRRHLKENETFISKILSRHQFEIFGIVVDTLSDEDVKFIIELINAHKIEHLALNIDQVSCVNPVEILLSFSSLVRSLQIRHFYPIGADTSRKYLFGVYDADWSSIILQLFSNKMDKLSIVNPHFPNYISRECAEVLRKRLPLVGKKVWFSGTCLSYADGLEYTENSHMIQVDKHNTGHIFDDRSLRVKHSSREKESCVFLRLLLSFLPSVHSLHLL